MSEENKIEEEVKLSEADEAKDRLLEAMNADNSDAKPVEDESKLDEKPEEVPADPEVKEEVAVEEEVQEPTNAAFARMRRELAEAKRVLAEKEEAANATSESDKADPVADLIKVWDSGDDASALISKIRKASSTELAEISEKALGGEYGEYGDDIYSLVSSSVSLAKVREEREAESKTTAQQRLIDEYQAELDESLEVYTEFKDENSTASKALDEFDKTLLGTIDPKTGNVVGDGVLPEELAAYIRSKPSVHLALADQFYKSSLGNSESPAAKVSVLEKEIESLRQKLSKYEELSDPTSPVSAGNAGSAEEVKARLMAAMGQQ